MPAGLRPIASPSSVDATAAPARAVDTEPEPGRDMPPAVATPIPPPCDTQTMAVNATWLSFIGTQRYRTLPTRIQRLSLATRVATVTAALRDPDMRNEDRDGCR